MGHKLFLIETHQNNPEVAILNSNESHHAINVLRHQQGDIIYCIDGLGSFYKCEILIVDLKGCLLKILSVTENFGIHNYNLHIAMAITKNTERFEWFLEKSIEIGINTISPIICQRSEKRNISTERLKKIALSSIKQSQRALLPTINEPIKVNQLIKNSIEQQRYIAHCNNDENKSYLANKLEANKSIIILIGPEGDFSPDEITASKQHNFCSIALSNNTLRTETAGIVACQIVNQTFFNYV